MRFLLASLVSLLVCSCQNPESSKETDVRTIEEKYPDGQVKTERVTSNDGKEEAIISYHPNGVRSREEHYEDGKKQGTWKLWRDDGSIRATQSFENDLLKGSRVEYDSLERKRKEVLDVGDSLRQEIWYHPNGIISTLNFYKKKRMHSKWFAWYDDGSVEVISDGFEGIYTDYHKSGGKKSEFTYTDPRSTEIKKFWDEKGSLEKIETWVDGELVDVKNEKTTANNR